MRIFILEDNPVRMDWFKKELIGHEIHHTDDAHIAKDMLTFNKYDMIFLDHDLGGEIDVDGDVVENTGLYVTRNIAYSPNKQTPIKIHSLNPIGAEKMAIELMAHGYEDISLTPFGTFNFN